MRALIRPISVLNWWFLAFFGLFLNGKKKYPASQQIIWAIKEPWLFSIIGNYIYYPVMWGNSLNRKPLQGMPSLNNHYFNGIPKGPPGFFWSVARLLSETLVELEASPLPWSHSATLPGSPNAPSTTVVVTWLLLFFFFWGGGGEWCRLWGEKKCLEGKPKDCRYAFWQTQKKKRNGKWNGPVGKFVVPIENGFFAD